MKNYSDKKQGYQTYAKGIHDKARLDDPLRIVQNIKIWQYRQIVYTLTKICSWNMKVTVILIVIGALWTIPKGWEMGLRNWNLKDEPRPFKLQHYRGRPEYREKLPEKTYCYTDSHEQPSVYAGVKNSQRSKIILLVYKKIWARSFIDFVLLSHIAPLDKQQKLVDI